MEKIDCKSFLQLVQLIVDGEATPEQEATFKRHYDKCAHCAEEYTAEASLLHFLKAKICACRQDAPGELARKIREQIAKAK